ncbi:MAG: isopeptide-forming domain-containing fimbrial protein [Lachnospiraceae bacterium]|jgi:fimbrial isopeptide formation D2 family protein/LPXTG-motif cell wall-anchored protein|nr:isopeptide-forming domain-containing fimbrial protein [Lachnospiraceae bacterium]
MKRMKKMVSLLLTLVMMVAMAAPAFATGADPADKKYSITITNTSDTVSMEGNTYKAYKLFNVTYSEGGSSYAYTIADEFQGFTYTSEEGEAYSGEGLIAYLNDLDDDSAQLNKVSVALSKYIQENSVPAKGEAAGGTEDSVTIELAEPGYYVVAGTGSAANGQTVTALCALTTTDPTADVNLKADAPTIDKNIDASKDTDENNGEDPVKNNNASIGDEIPFIVTSKVPVMTGYEKYYFVVTDTMDKGLTFRDNVEITVGDKTLEKDKDYTITITQNSTAVEDPETGDNMGVVPGPTTIEIVFKNFIQYQALAGEDIKITYSAMLNEYANLGTTGNKNSVDLTYSNNPNVQDDGDPENPDKPGPDSPTGKTPERDTYTYVTGLKLKKVNEDGETLTGAEFQITGTRVNTLLIKETIFVEDPDGAYWKLLNGDYTKTAPVVANDDTDTTKHYDDIDKKYREDVTTNIKTDEEKVGIKATVDQNGILTFDGLSAGNYEITEIKAPNGYNILKAPINVKITWNAPEEGSTECSWSGKYWDSEIWEPEVDNLELNLDGVLPFDVVNLTGTQLPSTGGMGTTIFYVLGSILLIGAGVLLVTKKKMSGRQ